MTTHSDDGNAPGTWVSVWISFFCFAESHNCESTENHAEQTESRVWIGGWVHTDTHAICPVSFLTVPCQQQTTAGLHICHTEMDRDTGALSSLHLLSCFWTCWKMWQKRFSIFPHAQLRHRLSWNTLCYVRAVSNLTCSIWSLCDICMFTI